MGPPFFDGGNKLQIFRTGVGGIQLQWGRRFLTAETQYRCVGVPGKRAASMGPPFFDGGNLTHFCGGCECTCASMGPPFFDGGNQTAVPLASYPADGFNGAAVF